MELAGELQLSTDSISTDKIQLLVSCNAHMHNCSNAMYAQ
jgi:hypothetical protein